MVELSDMPEGYWVDDEGRVHMSDYNHVDMVEQVRQVELARQLLESFPSFRNAPKHHTVKTPERLVKMLHQMTMPEEFNFTTFENDRIDEMIILSPIKFHTLCAHHTLPFHGVAHIAYIPDKTLAGLSKFARAVKYMCKGFWVQEELTNAIADYLEEKLEPVGLAVVMQGEHMCMSMRGVEADGIMTTTSSMRGVFLNPATGARPEFLSFIRSNHG